MTNALKRLGHLGPNHPSRDFFTQRVGPNESQVGKMWKSWRVRSHASNALGRWYLSTVFNSKFEGLKNCGKFGKVRFCWGVVVCQCSEFQICPFQKSHVDTDFRDL